VTVLFGVSGLGKIFVRADFGEAAGVFPNDVYVRSRFDRLDAVLFHRYRKVTGIRQGKPVYKRRDGYAGEFRIDGAAVLDYNLRNCLYAAAEKGRFVCDERELALRRTRV